MREAIAEHGGNVRRMARGFAYDQKHFYRLIYGLGLEGEVAAARAAATLPPTWLARTRAALQEEIDDGPGAGDEPEGGVRGRSA